MYLSLGLNAIEFSCYMTIFRERNNYHRKTLNTVFRNQPAIPKKRIRKNGITATGHFVTWLVEFGMFVSLVVVFEFFGKGMEVAIWTLFIPSANFVLYPAVQLFCLTATGGGA